MNSSKQAFFSVDDFPPLKELASEWRTVRTEYLALNAPLMDVNRSGGKSHQEVEGEVINKILSGAKYGWIEGWSWGRDEGNKDWTQYGLVVEDRPVDFASESMPQTLRLLRKIEGIHVAALARLAPHSLLSTHTHPELTVSGLLQMHITIEAPKARNYAYLNVQGEFRQHTIGNAFVFDGSSDHFALNCSDFERVILYLEFSKKQNSL